MSEEPIPKIPIPPPPTPLPENTVHGTSSSGAGVLGESNFGPGVSGRSVSYEPPYTQPPRGGNSDGVLGESGGTGVHGIGFLHGVLGESSGGDGVVGLCTSNKHAGVSATNDSGGYGVWARGTPGGHFESATDGVFGVGKNGVHGQTVSSTDHGVWGENIGGGYGVSGSTNSNSNFLPDQNPVAPVVAAVWGNNWGGGTGVKGTSNGGDGILGCSFASGHAGVCAVGPNGYGIFAYGSPAGHFEGDVEVTGDLFLKNQDCAEDFEISGEEQIEPGTVMAIDQNGTLRPSNHSYDRRVAGVLSGAGDYRPAIVLGKQAQTGKHRPIALVGKVYCKVDADYSAVDVGDLLTTSPTPGHAMKATDPSKAFGAVIGKALRRLEAGQGLIPVLVALQ